jgi:hypothetical protein
MRGVFVAAVFLASVASAGPITIGRGPRLGEAGGETYYEELADWTHRDLRALDPAGDERRARDGDDGARDLIAFYTRREAGALYARFDMLELGFGAEGRSLNLGILLDLAPGGQEWVPNFLGAKTAHPWELAVLLFDTDHYVIYDQAWRVVAGGAINPWVFKGAYFRSDLDGCELGVDLAALRWKGWDGRSAIGFQAFSWKDGERRLADAVGEASLDDGRLDTQIRETARAGTAKYSVILHGNQSIVNAGGIGDLIESHRIRTPAGKPTGYHRALEAHEVFGARVNIHVSGSLASSFAWARSSDPRRDGPAFNARIARFVDGNPNNGEGALMGGVFSEHILPYFEGTDVTPTSARLMERILDRIYSAPPPAVFWSPERVLRGSTFADVRAAGYRWTVVDQLNHLMTWYGAPDALSRRGNKINRINGVNCFVINDAADQFKFAVSDGGTWLPTRRQLLAKALDRDQEQLTLVFDDWEAFSGRSFTSFGVGNDNPDNYDAHLRWLSNHPWIQVVTLDDVASWGWTPIDRGQRNGLPLETYHWLQHASERSYDHWYYGSGAEESFRDLRPTLRYGHDAAKIYGDVWTAGTLLADVWSDVRGAPAGNLKTLAEMTYSAMLYETAWHDEDMHDYHGRTAAGDYLHPDVTYDRVSGWALGLHGHVREASVAAGAAHWASRAAPGTRAYTADVDQDGEAEAILENDRLRAVFEDDGGRLVALFVRDPQTGEGYQVIGAFPASPGSSRESEWEGDTNRNQVRASGLKDWWSTGHRTSRYVNDRYRAQGVASGWRFTSSDGRITKTVTLSGGRLEVRYDTDPSIGTLYVRCGLSPHVTDLVFSGQANLTATRQGNRFELANRAAGVAVTVDAYGAGLNHTPSDGSAVAPRNVALTHQVELSGRGSFRFAIEARAR